MLRTAVHSQASYFMTVLIPDPNPKNTLHQEQKLTLVRTIQAKLLCRTATTNIDVSWTKAVTIGSTLPACPALPACLRALRHKPPIRNACLCCCGSAYRRGCHIRLAGSSLQLPRVRVTMMPEERKHMSAPLQHMPCSTGFFVVGG